MRKTLLALTMVVLYGCGCMAQFPPQYVYVDSACTAILPDYISMAVVTDNCDLADITQMPPAGTPISATTNVELRAIDMVGNESSVYFNAILLDTIAPLIQLDPEWIGYTTKEIGTMYKTYYGWVQELGDYYNETVAGRIDTMVIPEMDTTIYYVNDTMKIFRGTIPITDPQFRIDQGYWQDVVPDLSAMFQ